MIFRFDDVSVNTNADKLGALIQILLDYDQGNIVVLAISSIVFDPSSQLSPEQHERVHPSVLTPQSSLTPYYRGTRCGVPRVFGPHPRVRYAGHGLMHVDHRLLERQTQEMSILGSCALAGAKIFVPPYNHWDHTTLSICEQHRIELVCYEHGWLHAKFQPYDRYQNMYYAHPFDFTPKTLTDWLGG